MKGNSDTFTLSEKRFTWTNPPITKMHLRMLSHASVVYFGLSLCCQIDKEKPFKQYTMSVCAVINVCTSDCELNHCVLFDRCLCLFERCLCQACSRQLRGRRTRRPTAMMAPKTSPTMTSRSNLQKKRNIRYPLSLSLSLFLSLSLSLSANEMCSDV